VDLLKETLSTIKSLRIESPSSQNKPITIQRQDAIGNHLSNSIEYLRVAKVFSEQDKSTASELVKALTRQISTFDNSFKGMKSLVALLDGLKVELLQLQCKLRQNLVEEGINARQLAQHSPSQPQ